MRALLAIALLGTLMSGRAMAQREIQVADGSSIPPVRACIDYVGRGALRMTGVTAVARDADALMADGLYRFRFDERSELVGESRWTSTDLYYTAHSLAHFTDRDSVVFLAKVDETYRFVGWARVWRDREGKAFIPIYAWPTAESRDWEPQAIRQFAKPVEYRGYQKFVRDVEVPGLIERKDGQIRILHGLYLSDIPAMFAAATREDCWR